MLFFYVNVGSSIADDKVVDIKNRVDCGAQAFNDIVDSYWEEYNKSDTSLLNRNTWNHLTLRKQMINSKKNYIIE